MNLNVGKELAALQRTSARRRPSISVLELAAVPHIDAGSEVGVTEAG